MNQYKTRELAGILKKKKTKKEENIGALIFSLDKPNI